MDLIESIERVLQDNIRLVAKPDTECEECGEALLWKVKDGNLRECAEKIAARLRSEVEGARKLPSEEQIARIIDPAAMLKYEKAAASGQRAANGKLWADVAHSTERNLALCKARAIRALLVSNHSKLSNP